MEAAPCVLLTIPMAPTPPHHMDLRGLQGSIQPLSTEEPSESILQSEKNIAFSKKVYNASFKH